MWHGKIDEYIKSIAKKYLDEFGCSPDSYEEIAYERMTYEQFCGFIEECLEKHVEIPDVVE